MLLSPPHLMKTLTTKLFFTLVAGLSYLKAGAAGSLSRINAVAVEADLP